MKFRTAHQNTNLVYRIKMKISQIGKLHSRRVYGLFDLMGDLGGVLELIVVTIGIFVAPISRFSFTVDAAKKLFFARSTKLVLWKNDELRNV